MKMLTRMSVMTLFMLMASVPQAHATMVSFTLTGVVDHAADNDWFYATDPFGLQSGNQLTATATLDSSLIKPTGFSLIDFSDPWLGIDMNIQLGTGNYSNADEVFGGPRLHFYHGYFDGLDYRSTDWENDSSDWYFDGRDFDGHWQHAEISPVPLHAAVWLMAFGLIGLSVFPARHNLTRRRATEIVQVRK